MGLSKAGKNVASDAIEREIFIEAGIEHVWSLVSKVGFWIGDELRFDREGAEGEVVVVDTDKHGNFPVRVDRLDAPHYAAYRWASAFPGEVPDDVNSTLVEFSLIEQDGGVLVRLRESDFNELAGGVTVRQAARDANVTGWERQLDLLRQAATEVTIG